VNYMSNIQETFTNNFSRKIPIYLAIIYFGIVIYISFFHHPYWFSDDGVLYFWWGDQILQGNGENVEIFDSPPGGSIIHAALNYLIQDAFISGKIISIFSGLGIILLSYYITNNFFNRNIALLTQLFFVFNPRILFLSVEAVNELLPIFFIMISFYFITKKEFSQKDVILSTVFLGISSMLRSQSLPIFLGLFAYLLIREKQNFTKFKYPLLCLFFFFLTISPLMFYNYTSHGVFLEGNSDWYAVIYYEYQTPEWRELVEANLVSESRQFQVSMLADFNLFLKNYFYNLFFHNPNLLFNFNTFSNISLISAIPFISLIPVFGGFLYSIKFKLNKLNIYVLISTILSSIFAILFFGDFTIHYFAIFIIPMISLGILNFKYISKSFSILIFISTIYWIIISIAKLGQPYQLLPVIITTSILSSLFFIEFLPNLKLTKSHLSVSQKNKLKNFSLLLIFLILMSQTIFAGKFLETHLYSYDVLESSNIETYDLQKILDAFNLNHLPPRGSEYFELGTFLSNQPDIDESYIMTRWLPIAYYADSKLVYTTFTEGKSGDGLNTFISRENWSDFDMYVSNRYSNPSDRHNLLEIIPDYLVYQKLSERHYPYNDTTQVYDLMILGNPNDPNIPENFEFVYKSNQGEFFVYKIHH
jgi:hypothetical protein